MAEVEPPPGTDWIKVIFSAKEAVYKCIGPLVGRWVGFKEVELEVRPGPSEFGVRRGEGGHFAARLDQIHGRYRVDGGLVISTAVLPMPDKT